LRRAAMTAAVVRNDAVAAGHEEHHLRIPIVSRQRPAVAEHNGLTRAPVLVENLDAISGGDGWHGLFSFFLEHPDTATPLPRSKVCSIRNGREARQQKSPASARLLGRVTKGTNAT